MSGVWLNARNRRARMKSRKLAVLKEPGGGHEDAQAGLSTAAVHEQLYEMVLYILDMHQIPSFSPHPQQYGLFLLVLLRLLRGQPLITWLAILAVDLSVHWHRHRLVVHEIPNRIRLLAERLRTVSVGAQESRYPWCTQSAASDGSILFRVWRDGRLVLAPCNLLWRGDLVELVRGDAAPCRVSREGQVLPMDSPIQVSGRYTVDCEDDQHPLLLQLQAALQSPAGPHLLLADVLALLAPVLLPMAAACLFVALPLLLFVRTVFETARISLLADQLKQSRIPYADDEFDEFDDEAPPPTKDIHLPTIEVLRRAWSIATGPASNHALVLDWLVWQKDLTQMLSSVSVMAFLDREGPIASPLPRPIEVIIPVADAAELASAEILPDVNNPSRVVIGFSDAVLKSREQLKAVGLACLLCSDCMQRGAAHRKDWHKRRSSCLACPSSLHPSLQTCLCPVARAIGFSDAAAKGFTLLHEHWQSASDSSWIAAQFFGGTVVKTGSDFSHVLCFGDLRAVLDASSDAWDTHSIVPISESLRWKLRDLWQDFMLADIDTLAFAYLPVKGESVRNEYVLLGVIAVAFDPREDMQEFIDDLGQAGIRFVYFSPYSERISKAFGERLGLETDWNSCILLSTAPQETGMPAISARVTRSHGYSALSDIKARLPRGPANIRQHLLSVDDIPLHVSIFAECRSEPGLIEAMLGIYGEWHETVAVIGSLVADKTVESAGIFAKADVAIGMLPGQLDEATLLGASFFGASCSFLLPFESSPYVLTELIREARTLFRIRSQHGELFLYLAVLAIRSPCSIPVAACLACSFYTSPYDPNIMKSIAQRRPNHRRTILWTLVKLAPVAIGAFFANPSGVPLLLVLSACMAVPREAIRTNYFFFVFSTFILLISAAFGHPLRLFLQAAVLGTPIVLTHFLVDHHLCHQHDEEQKRAKLEFNTKLGMHSPV